MINPVCVVGHLISGVTGGVASSVLGGIAGAIQSGIGSLVKDTITWWVAIPSPDLASEPAIGRMQQWVLPITIGVAVGCMIAAGARMALTRKANPLMDISGGLVTLATATTLGVIAATLLLKAGDAWANWILQVSTGGQFGQRMTTLLSLSSAAPAIVVVLGVVVIILAALQAILMLFRQASLVILAGLLPLAAAGSLGPLTRGWIRKVVSWMLALICYKPAAAAVYATAFTMIGSGTGTRTVLEGFAMVALSLVAMPVLVRFFTWSTGAVGGAAGGGGQWISAAVSGAAAAGALRVSPGSASASDQATYISGSLGPAPQGASSAAGPGGSGTSTPGANGPSGRPGHSPNAGPTPSAQAAPAGSAAASAPAAGTAAGAGAGAAGAGAGAAGAAAGGPAGAAAAQVLAQGAKGAADAATGAMGGGESQ
jgi:hypothetical protein